MSLTPAPTRRGTTADNVSESARADNADATTYKQRATAINARRAANGVARYIPLRPASELIAPGKISYRPNDRIETRRLRPMAQVAHRRYVRAERPSFALMAARHQRRIERIDQLLQQQRHGRWHQPRQQHPGPQAPVVSAPACVPPLVSATGRRVPAGAHHVAGSRGTAGAMPMKCSR